MEETPVVPYRRGKSNCPVTMIAKEPTGLSGHVREVFPAVVMIMKIYLEDLKGTMHGRPI